MHVDGTWGTFGAVTVTAAGRLLGLSPAVTLDAIRGAACQLPWSLYLPIAEGATVRNTYVGEAARRGITQALAAAAGITAPAGAIPAFDRLALGGDPTAKRLAPAGQWLLEEGCLKPFAAVRHVHYGAEAAIQWRDGHDPADTTGIRELSLEVYGEALRYCGNRAPATAIQAQFSLSYGLAWTLARGDLGADAYAPESLADPEVRRLEALAELVEVAGWDGEGKRAARLTVVTADGAETLAVRSVLGDVDRPLSPAEVRDKFARYAAPGLGSERARALATRILEAPLATPLQALLAS